jgi:GNAT superfamily N-acetyltransferase
LIRQLSESHIKNELKILSEAASAEGYHFVQRTIEEWESRANQFSHPKEILLGYFIGSHIVGMCGLNIDPFSEENETGRLRHLYTHPDFRKQGIAGQLVQSIIQNAGHYFTRIRLRTDNPIAERFYLKCGFQQVTEEDATHCLELKE